MTKLEKTSAPIAEMSTEEKAQLLAELLQYFHFPATGISHPPGVCGGRACIRDTRIPVWTIVEAKEQSASHAGIVVCTFNRDLSRLQPKYIPQ